NFQCSLPTFSLNGEGKWQMSFDVDWGLPVPSVDFGGVQIWGIVTGGQVVQFSGNMNTGTFNNVVNTTYFPAVPTNWTIYALSYKSPDKVNTYVPGLTPFAIVVATPPPTGQAGTENAPLVTPLTGFVIYPGVSVDGVEQFAVTGTLTPPSKSTNPNYGGCQIVLRPSSGNDI